MSLHGTYDPQNVFARMIRGEIPASTLFEDEAVMAFLDLFPQSPGHTLVISKTSQARNILEVEPQALSQVMAGVQRAANAIKAVLNPDGLIVTQFNGAAAGQTVFHLHVHIIPRWIDADIAGHGSAKMGDAGELASLAEKIRAKLA